MKTQDFVQLNKPLSDTLNRLSFVYNNCLHLLIIPYMDISYARSGMVKAAKCILYNIHHT